MEAEQAFLDTANSDGGAASTQQPASAATETQQQPAKKEETQAANLPQVEAPSQLEVERKQWEADRKQWEAERKELQRKHDQISGTYGESKKRLERLEAEKQQAAEAEAKRKSTDIAQQWAALNAEYPELAGPISAKMAELEEQLAMLREREDQHPKETQDRPEQQNPEAMAKAIERQVALKMYTQMHPDANQHAWTAIENGQEVQKFSPNMQSWLSTLQAEERENTIKSEDPVFVSSQLSRFKDWVKQKEVAAREAKDKAQQRMKSAIMPKSSAPALQEALTAEDAFNRVAMT